MSTIRPVRIGVDVGGTFTDGALYVGGGLGVGARMITAKVATTAEDPSIGIGACVDELCARAGLSMSDVDVLLHGTTIATNGLLEHRGSRTGLITTSGFRDILHIARHQRPENYSVMQDIPWQARELIRRRDRRTVVERVGANGVELVPLDEAGLMREALSLADAGVDSLVVCFINSYRNTSHELRAVKLIREALPDLFVTASCEVIAQFREFERFTTTAINGFLGPSVHRYINGFVADLAKRGLPTEPQIMMSNGGAASPRYASDSPARLLMSGPAAGVIGGRWAGDMAGVDHAVTFDMGGTSADIGTFTSNGIREAAARDTWIAGFPVLTPMVDVMTVGAGGGSIARVDEGGALHVGPRSAGAVPGPACYERGGSEATVTDANAVLGRLDSEHPLAGSLRISVSRARGAVGVIAERLHISVEEAADGIIRVADSNMSSAIRSQTIQRGIDPRSLSLVAFGGAGPLHAADLADDLGMMNVVVPSSPGITSAVGLIATPLSYDTVSTVFELASDCDIDLLGGVLSSQRKDLRGRLDDAGLDAADVEYSISMDCRYIGQGYELKIDVNPGALSRASIEDVVKRFHAAHEREYGHCFPDHDVELVNVKTQATQRIPDLAAPALGGGDTAAKLGASRTASAWFRTADGLRSIPTTYLTRESLSAVRGTAVRGPAVITQEDTTIVVPPNWVCEERAGGSLVLYRTVIQRAAENA